MGIRGGLDSAAEINSLPSTLTYKERITLRDQDATSYAKLYNIGRDQQVWGRLHYDAGVRNAGKALRPTPPEPLFGRPADNSFAMRDTLSGYVSNTTKAVFSTTTFKTGHLKFEGDVPVESLRPMQQRRFKQLDGVSYFAAIRPDAESTNQTLRMMGTYQTDFPHAERGQMFIPSGCPGGPPTGSWYHADVRLTRSADFANERLKQTV